MSDSLAFAMGCFRGDVFLDWLRELNGVLYAHGAELVDALGGGSPRYPTGMGDNVYAAERLLKAAVAENVIVQRAWEPTPSQQFFSLCPSLRVKKKSPEYRSAVEFGYSPGPALDGLLKERV